MGKVMRVIVADPVSVEALERLRSVATVETAYDASRAALLELVADCDGLIVRSRTPVDAELLERADRLKVVGRAGVGLEHVDVAAASKRGVVVVYTPEASTRAVAELAIGLMLSVERRIAACDRAIRSEPFEKVRRESLGRSLEGLVLGIVGMGRIGKAVGRIASVGLGMRVLYNDVVRVGPFDFEAKPVEKAELYERSDVVSLHVPLTEQTRSLIDAAALARFKPAATLINTSRGAVVDAAALSAALANGRLGGAGLDVVDPEPLPPEHALLRLQNVVLTPHAGAQTTEAQRAMDAVVDDVIAVLGGRGPRFPAT